MIHKISTSVTASESGSNSGTTVSATAYQTASNAIAVDTVYGTVTDEDLPISFTTANVKSLVLLANKDVTIKVNDSSSPDVTLNLKAGVALAWQADGYFTNPLSAATTVSHFYITSTSSVRFQALVISN